MNISLREGEVLELIAHEYTSKEIAQQLYISNHTAISHRQNLREKLGVRNTVSPCRLRERADACRPSDMPDISSFF
jgi:DNA-binding CsgD family transcriptional regulator